jgi:hypothetical protein
MQQSLLIFTSVCWVMNLSLSLWDMALQWIQPGFSSARPHTCNAVLCVVYGISGRQSCWTGILHCLRKEFYGYQLHQTEALTIIISWVYLKDRVFQKNLHTILGLKTAIQSDIEAISTKLQLRFWTILFFVCIKFVIFRNTTCKMFYCTIQISKCVGSIQLNSGM